MNKTITAGLALLLLAGTAAPALAQNDDHPWNRQGGPRREGATGERPGMQHQQAQPPPAAAQAPPRGPQHGPGEQRAPGGEQRRGPEGHPGGWRDGGGPPPQGRPDQRWNGGDRRPEERRPEDRRADERHWNGGGPRPDEHRWTGTERRWEGGRPDRNWRPSHPVWQSPQRYRGYAWRAPRGYYARSWAYGDVLPRGWFASNYWIGDWYRFDLPEPPPGYVWVRVGYDALLVDEFDGRVVEVVRMLFW